MASSEFGGGEHLHHGLDMRVVKLWHFSFVEAGSLCGLELTLVDVAVVVSNRRDKTSINWIEFRKTNHIWSQIGQILLVSSFEEVVGAGPEESSLVERHRVEAQLLQGEVRETPHEGSPDVLVFDQPGLEHVAGTLKHDVDQVVPGHRVDIKSEKLVLFGLAGRLAVSHHVVDLLGVVAGTRGQSSL